MVTPQERPQESGFLLPLLNDPALREELVAAGEVKEWSEGTVIFREGDTGSSVFVVLAGWVEAISEEGYASDPLGPGSLLGEVSALNGQPRSATVRALGDVRTLELTALNDFIESHPDVGIEWLKLYGRRVEREGVRPI
jgi:CRP-like cAMP-binding protein